MDERTSNPPRLTRAQLAALACSLVFGLLACVAGRKHDSPVHGWWEERGPVVPHASFPADCSLCHTGEAWTPLRADFAFDHLAETGFELVGAHTRAQCLRCHNDRGPVQVFAVRGCAGCHEDVHRGQLGKDCRACHDEVSWRPDAMIAMHQRTRFPLVGAHAATACWRCHPGAQVGNFTRASVECSACHAADLARAVPNHFAQGWTDSCQRCHGQHTFQGAFFDHRFPITSGKHAGFACQSCHTTPGSFATFSCISCHAHSKREMDDEHDDVRGYVYSTPACYACHPDGKK